MVVEDSTNAHVARCMHEMKRLVDVLNGHAVGDVLVKPEFILQVTFDKLRNLSTSLDTSECGTSPHTSSDELKWGGLKERASRGHTNDDRFSPALVARLDRASHQIWVSYALKRAAKCKIYIKINHQ